MRERGREGVEAKLLFLSPQGRETILNRIFCNLDVSEESTRKEEKTLLMEELDTI